ncbi:MAG: hypothetical protein FJX57_05025 [Alphaproteobacteria bacterium]|nr:hypothetical protein [Alphaproteobacteria bacterium]
MTGAPGTTPRRETPAARRAPLALVVGGARISLSGIFVNLADVGPQASALFRIAGAAPYAGSTWHWHREPAAPARGSGAC